MDGGLANRREALALPMIAVAGMQAPSVAVAAAPTRFGPGAHRIDRDLQVTGTLVVEPGARIVLARGAALTLTGDMVAPAEPIFSGPGTVDLTRSRLLFARPEWWGAAPDDPAVDCLPALTACLRAHPATQLGAGDYFLGDTLVIDQPGRRIWGIGRHQGVRGTRLVLAGPKGAAGEGAVVLVGSRAAPPTINDYLAGIDMRHIELGRARAAAPPGAAPAALAVGLAIRHVLDCTFEGLRANEHAVGFSIVGAVRTFLRECAAFRSIAGDPRDVFVGFDMDGRGSPLATGANASLYLIDCVARTGGRPRLAKSVGVALTGLLSDTFLVRLETTELGTGILVDGRAATLSDAGRRAGHVNCVIEMPVLDQCLAFGIELSGLSDGAMMEIRSPYIALAAGGRTALAIRESGGGIAVSGGQMIGWTAADAVGILLDRVSGAAFGGTQITGFARPVNATDASGLELVVRINNPDGSPQPAIRLTRCRAYLRPRIAGRFAAAVAADPASVVTMERNEVATGAPAFQSG